MKSVERYSTGKGNMVKLDLLKKKIENSGMTIAFIANKSNIVRATLYNRLNGKSEFTASEISALAKTLQMSTEERDYIFLE